MDDISRHALREALQANYEELRRRLTRRLGSKDAATAALHDVFVRIEQGSTIGLVERPLSYLYRMAMNAALNRRRAERDLLSASDIAELVNMPDDEPGAERAVSARHDVEIVLKALEELPALRREIFLAAWLDRKTQVQIAAEFRVHKRTVQKEIDRVKAYLKPIFFDDDVFSTAFGDPDVSSK